MTSSLDFDEEWPSFNEELSRKTTETLSKWSSAYNAEKISKREFYILVSGLYDTTSGLVNKDVSDLLADIHKELRKP